MDLTGAWTSTTHFKAARSDAKVLSVWQCAVLMSKHPEWGKLNSSLQMQRPVEYSVTYREKYWNSKGFDGMKGLRYERVRSRLALRFDDMNTRVTPLGGIRVRVPARQQVTLSSDDGVLFENRRQLAKYHASVRKSVDEWWRSMPKDSRGSLVPSTHHWMTEQLYRALVIDGSHEELEKYQDEDWKCDGRGCMTMDSLLFHQMIMQMVDVWCETVELNEFVDFILCCTKVCQGAPPIEENHAADTMQYIHKVLSTSLLRGGIRVSSLSEESRAALGGLGTFIRAIQEEEIVFPDTSGKGMGYGALAVDVTGGPSKAPAAIPSIANADNNSSYVSLENTNGAIDFDFLTFCAFMEASFHLHDDGGPVLEEVVVMAKKSEFTDPATAWAAVLPRDTLMYFMAWEVKIDGLWLPFSIGLQPLLHKAFEDTTTLHMDDLGKVFITPWTFDSSAGPLRCRWRYRWECVSGLDGKTWVPYPSEMQTEINKQWEQQVLADVAHPLDPILHGGGIDAVELVDFGTMSATTLTTTNGPHAIPRVIRAVEITMDQAHFDSFEETVITASELRPTRDPVHRTTRSLYEDLSFMKVAEQELVSRTLRRPSLSLVHTPYAAIVAIKESNHDFVERAMSQISMRFPSGPSPDSAHIFDGPSRFSSIQARAKELRMKKSEGSFTMRPMPEDGMEDGAVVVSFAGRKTTTLATRRGSNKTPTLSDGTPHVVGTAQPPRRVSDTTNTSQLRYALPAISAPKGSLKTTSHPTPKRSASSLEVGRGAHHVNRTLSGGVGRDLFRLVDFPVTTPASNLRLLHTSV